MQGCLEAALYNKRVEQHDKEQHDKHELDYEKIYTIGRRWRCKFNDTWMPTHHGRPGCVGCVWLVRLLDTVVAL